MSAVDRRTFLGLSRGILRRVVWAALGFAFAVPLGGCGTRSHPQVGNGETHFLFLDRCATDSECGDGLRCACGACTRDCKAEASCSELSREAACQPLSSTDDRCAAERGARVCVQPCHGNDDCSDFGASECRDGACTVPQTSMADGGPGPNSGTGGKSGSDGKNPIDGGPGAYDGGCTSGSAPYYDRAGCNGSVAPVCAGPAFDACLAQVCGCDGETLNGCGFYQKPWAHAGACTDAGHGDGG